MQTWLDPSHKSKQSEPFMWTATYQSAVNIP